MENESSPPSFFFDASVEASGVTITLSADDCRPIQNGLNYWHGPGDPSTWLTVAIFLEARRRVGGTDNAAAFELAAQALGVSAQKVSDSIEWHENYMRWHDGDPDYSVL